MGHLDLAMRESVLNLSNLTVLTDATNQKIALKKWVARECKIQVRSGFRKQKTTNQVLVFKDAYSHGN